MLALLLGTAFALQEPGFEAIRTGEQIVRSGHAEEWLARPATDWPGWLTQFTIARLSHRTDLADSLAGELLLSAPAAYRSGLLHLIGLRLLRQGKAGGAVDTLRLAIIEAEEAGEHSILRESRVALALAFSRLGWSDSAMSILERADASGPHSDRFTALSLCARAQISLLTGGQRPAARAREGAAIAERAGEASIRASCLATYAAAVQAAGYTDSALVVYERVVRLMRELRDEEGLASVLQWRGFIRRTQGDFSGARQDQLEAVELATRTLNQSALGWALLNLGIMSWSLGDVGVGLDYARKASAVFAEQQDVYAGAVARGSYASYLSLLGRLDDAIEQFRVATELAREARYPPTLRAARIGLANAHLRSGELDSARAVIAEVLQDEVAAGLDTTGGYANYVAAAVDLAAGDVASAMHRLVRGLPEVGEDRPELRYQYRSRLAQARAMSSDLAGAEEELRSAARELDRWRDGLEQTELRLRVFDYRPDLADRDVGQGMVLGALTRAARAGAVFEMVERRRGRELLDQVARQAAIAGVDDPDLPEQPVSDWRDVGRSLPPGHVLLQYAVFDRDSTIAILVTRDSIAAELIATGDGLESAIRRLRIVAESGVDIAEPLGAELWERLVPKELEPGLVGSTAIVVIPDGPIHALPFELLRPASGQPIGMTHIIGYAPSASMAVRALRSRDRTHESVSVMAVGDPSLDEPALPRLSRARREASLAASFGERSTVLVGDRATEEALRSNLSSGYDVLHFATHATVDERNPSSSALLLAGGGGHDGRLTLGEIGALRLEAELVTLSACSTVEGPTVAGEGVVGLARAFMGAGARTIVATRWRIADEHAHVFSAEFYKAMAGGATAGDAMRRARSEVAARGLGPEVWAAFLLAGDSELVLPLSRDRNHVIPLVLLGVVALYGLTRRIRRNSERIMAPSG